MSPQIVYPEKGVRLWAQLTGAGVGVGAVVGDMPPKKLCSNEEKMVKPTQK